MPWSSPDSSVARASSSLRVPYQPISVMQPKPSADSCTPVLPKGRCCMVIGRRLNHHKYLIIPAR